MSIENGGVVSRVTGGGGGAVIRDGGTTKSFSQPGHLTVFPACSGSIASDFEQCGQFMWIHKVVVY